MIEETKGAFPVWLSPVQVKVLPITDRQQEYAKQVADRLMEQDIRVEVDDRNEKIGYKIREAQMQKVPYMLVVGDKEVEINAVGVRSRKEGDIGQMSQEDFIQRIKYEVETFAKD